MSGRKDREYSVIKKGLQSMEEALENMKKDAEMLDTAAATAENELKDEVGKQDIKALKELAEAITDAVNPGVERIRELEQRVDKDEGDFERLLQR